MRKLIILLLIVVGGYFIYQYLDENIEKKDDVTVAECSSCEYMINDHKVNIKDGVVYIDDKIFNNIDKVMVKEGIILLVNDKSIIGYNKKQLFHYYDGFDSAYPGMKIESIQVADDKIIIKTTRIVDRTTIDIGTNFSICSEGVLNYSGLKENKIDVTEPVTLTYDINYDDYKAIISYKYSLGDYYKEEGSC